MKNRETFCWEMWTKWRPCVRGRNAYIYIAKHVKFGDIWSLAQCKDHTKHVSGVKAWWKHCLTLSFTDFARSQTVLYVLQYIVRHCYTVFHLKNNGVIRVINTIEHRMKLCYTVFYGLKCVLTRPYTHLHVVKHALESHSLVLKENTV